MDAIQINAPAVARCPHCGGKLDGHPVPVSDNGNSTLEPGDIYVPPEPTIIRQSEHMKTGQAAQAKQAHHRIPGMPVKAAPPPPPIVRENAAGLQVLDDPRIGGKMTICVLLYGREHYQLHRRCLTSICQTVPPSRLDLRVGANQIGPDTVKFLRSLPVTKIYADDGSRLKYPAMREMFWDTETPITTSHVVWFDDDSYVREKEGKNWLIMLAQTILAQPPSSRVGLYGDKMLHPLPARRNDGGDPREWFKKADWWQNRNFQTRQGQESPNGSVVHFAVGGFFCLSLEAIRACNIPDVRLIHNGGDACIGEQIHQGGYRIKSFNEGKKLIHTSAAPPRGKSVDGRSKLKIMPWY